MTACPSAERLASNEMSADERGAWLDHAAACPQCRAIALVMSHGELPADAARLAMETIDRYVITRELGRGAMGVVYAAEDPELGRPIAIKVLHDATAADRSRREARVLGRLDHPNVVRIFDVGETGGRTFIAMELVAGENMRRWLAVVPRTQREILGVLRQAGQGLAAAHAAGVVHRDFKPDNVLVAPGRVVVGDFGLSSFGAVQAAPSRGDVGSEDRLTLTGSVVGTPAYMPPEQIDGATSAASDQFAFCVAAWEALFGARPFAGATVREIRMQVEAGMVLRPVTARIPRRLERALRRGLAPRPADRFPSMDVLLTALAPRRRWPFVAAGGAVVVAGLAVAVATRAAEDPCARVADAIFEGGRHLTAEQVQYAQAWRAARLALCRAPETSDLREVERRAAREACYERARIEHLRQVRGVADITSRRTIPLAACESGVALSEAPGTAADPRGCGCPYSPCDVETRACTGECSARAFRLVGPIEGVAVASRQEAVIGATHDGARLLYLAGPECRLDHLYLATHDGTRYVSFDLTPQLVAHGMRIVEGCCTLARDGRALVVAAPSGFVRFTLEGTTVGPPDLATFANLPRLEPGQWVSSPVLASDEHAIYFSLGSRTDTTRYVATRRDPTHPYAAAERLTGRAAAYEYITGISDDAKSLFMANEFSTRVLVRQRLDAPFGDLSLSVVPSRLPGWRTIPIDGCRRLIATVTPGGCESEESVLFEAVGP